MSSNLVQDRISCGLKDKIVQIHPTLSCNIFCKHCYSNSGPAEKLALDPKALLDLVEDVADMGYKVISVSGGEPLMYKEIEKVLSYAKSLGLRTTITTNGTLLDELHLSKLKNCVDLIAVSLDGPPLIHNRIRGSSTAFERLSKGLKVLKDLNFTFGVIHTLTNESWEHLLWIAEFASKNGASLLQIHPLENTGRAKLLDMQHYLNDDEVLARVYLLSVALSAKYENLAIQFDTFHKEYVLGKPELIYASKLDTEMEHQKSSDLLHLLVVEADGSVVPISYGMSKKYEICNIHTQRLRDAWPKYLQKGNYVAFRKLCADVCKQISKPSLFPFFNWYEMLVDSSYESSSIIKGS